MLSDCPHLIRSVSRLEKKAFFYGANICTRYTLIWKNEPHLLERLITKLNSIQLNIKLAAVSRQETINYLGREVINQDSIKSC